MGCFNGTCAISHLPICYGDKVVLIPLYNKRDVETFSPEHYYPDDTCFPFGFPIVGDYNDYGGIENFNMTNSQKEFYNGFLFESKEFNQKSMEFESSFIPFSDFKSEKDFVNGFICSGGYCIQGDKTQFNKSGMNGVSSIMVHYDLYKALTDEMKNRHPYGKEETVSEYILNRMNMFYEKYYSKIEDFKKRLENTSSENIRSVYEDISYETYHLAEDIKEVLFGSNNINDFYLKKIATLLFDHPEWKDEILNQMFEQYIFHLVLSQMRCGYGINSGLGSQSNETRLHIIMADFIKEYVKNQTKRYEEDEEDSDCSNGYDGIAETLFFFDYT